MSSGPAATGLTEPGSDVGAHPDFEYALALGLRPAPIGRRALAFGVEAAIVVVVAVPGVIGMSQLLAAGASGTAGSLVPVILLLSSLFAGYAFVLTQVALHGLKGVTVGKAIFGIRSVRAATLGKPGFWRMLWRALILQVSLWFPPLAVVVLLSPLWDPGRRGRGWLDRAGGNWLIDVAQGLDPYDAKALRLAKRTLEPAAGPAPTGLPSLATVFTGSAIEPIPFVPAKRLESAIVGVVQQPLPASPAQPAPQAHPQAQAHAQAHPQAQAHPLPRVQPLPTVQPLPGAHPAPAARGPLTEALLLFDDGTRIHVSGSGLIGRNPEPRAQEAVGMLVPIADDSWSVSKTHAAFGFDDRGFWIVDRASRNGTSLRVGEEFVRVPTHSPTPVGEGQTVMLGERSFVVLGSEREADE